MPDFLKKIRAAIGNELIVLPSAAAAVFDGRGRLLLIRESDSGQWALPGGCIDPMERPADAAAREVLEETGLRIQPHSIVGVYSGPEFVIRYSNGDQVSYVMTLFRARLSGDDGAAGELAPDRDEVLEARFVTRTEAEDMPLRSWLRLIFPQVWQDTEAAHFVPPPSAATAG